MQTDMRIRRTPRSLVFYCKGWQLKAWCEEKRAEAERSTE
jgi:hypothetical protein